MIEDATDVDEKAIYPAEVKVEARQISMCIGSTFKSRDTFTHLVIGITSTDINWLNNEINRVRDRSSVIYKVLSFTNLRNNIHFESV